MARIRTVKPEFWTSESVGRLTRDARLLFIALWNLADDSGRLRGGLPYLSGAVFPYDEDARQGIAGWIEQLEREGMVRSYKGHDGNSYLDIPKWSKHQKIEKPSPSRIPAFTEASPNTPRILPEASPLDQGSSIRDLVPWKGAEIARAQDEEIDQQDLTAPTPPAIPGAIPGQAVSDSDRWRYEIGQAEWARAIKRAGGKIGADNWPTWQGLMDRIGLEAIITTLAKLPATERWPDQVEDSSGTGPASRPDDSEISKALRDEVQRRARGDVFVKSASLLTAARRYGVAQVLALADHAGEIGAGISKELGNFWFNGRKSAYGGWDFYEPKRPLEQEQSAEEIAKALGIDRKARGAA